jgi:hypothetical protein
LQEKLGHCHDITCATVPFPSRPTRPLRGPGKPVTPIALQSFRTLEFIPPTIVTYTSTTNFETKEKRAGEDSKKAKKRLATGQVYVL